jgi:hypothetical protein
VLSKPSADSFAVGRRQKNHGPLLASMQHLCRKGELIDKSRNVVIIRVISK